VFSNRLRIGRGEARRRLDEADDLGPRIALTGELLQPVLPNVAAAQADGKIGRNTCASFAGFLPICPTPSTSNPARPVS
jgi:hypothetical protein